MAALLDVVDIHKSYGTLEVLKGVSFSVGEKEIFAIIGPNGAGKTTLFKVMTGEVSNSSGRVVFEGRDITRQAAFRRAHGGFGRTFQVARIFPEFTALDNVIVAIEARQRSDGSSTARWYQWRPTSEVLDEAEVLMASLGLTQAASQEARFLSHGDKKRLEFAMALAGRPKVLMLDEPTAGMSPTDRMATAELIRKIRLEQNLAVVMTEHDMEVIFGLSDRLMVLNYGEIIAVGTPTEVRANKLVRDVYLGQEMIHA